LKISNTESVIAESLMPSRRFYTEHRTHKGPSASGCGLTTESEVRRTPFHGALQCRNGCHGRLVAESTGRHPRMVAKGIGKIRAARIAQRLCNRADIQGCLHKQALRPAHTLITQKLRHTDTQLLAKNTGNPFLADAQGL